MSRLLKDEQPHHLAAFERYQAMGEGRSYTRLAEELGALAGRSASAAATSPRRVALPIRPPPPPR